MLSWETPENREILWHVFCIISLISSTTLITVRITYFTLFKYCEYVEDTPLVSILIIFPVMSSLVINSSGASPDDSSFGGIRRATHIRHRIPSVDSEVMPSPSAFSLGYVRNVDAIWKTPFDKFRFTTNWRRNYDKHTSILTNNKTLHIWAAHGYVHISKNSVLFEITHDVGLRYQEQPFLSNIG